MSSSRHKIHKLYDCVDGRVAACQFSVARISTNGDGMIPLARTTGDDALVTCKRCLGAMKRTRVSRLQEQV